MLSLLLLRLQLRRSGCRSRQLLLGGHSFLFGLLLLLPLEGFLRSCFLLLLQSLRSLLLLTKCRFLLLSLLGLLLLQSQLLGLGPGLMFSQYLRTVKQQSNY